MIKHRARHGLLAEMLIKTKPLRHHNALIPYAELECSLVSLRDNVMGQMIFI